MSTTVTLRTTAWLAGPAVLLLAGCLPVIPQPTMETQTMCDESTYPADKDGVVKKHSVCRVSIKKGEAP